VDTGSHLLLGLTLAGASLAIPAVAADPSLQHALIAASLVGSHAPDFDAVARLKGETVYLRHHRGITHSLPAPAIWAAAIGLPAAWLFGVWEQAALLFLWTMLAVIFHIALDLFNGYGVQCLRPFTRRWLHLDSLCLFDPYIFGAHAAAALLWLTGVIEAAAAGAMFDALYGATFAYMLWRLLERRRRKQQLERVFGPNNRITLLPHMSGLSWQFVIDGADAYETGTIGVKGIAREGTIRKSTSLSGSEPVVATLGTDGVRAFLSFATNVHVQVQERLDGYEVIWGDVRFWHNHKLPYTAAVTLDRQLNVLGSKLAWDKKTWEPPYV